PPRTGGDRVVVGDHHAPAAVDARERGDHAGAGRALIAGEDVAVVDEGADLEGVGAGIAQAIEALARGQLALLVRAVGAGRAPAGVGLAPAGGEAILERGEGGAVIARDALVDEPGERVTERRERDEGHARLPYHRRRRVSSRMGNICWSFGRV